MQYAKRCRSHLYSSTMITPYEYASLACVTLPVRAISGAE